MMIFISSTVSYGQTSLNRPFTSCYEQEFDSCSNCSPETLGWKTIHTPSPVECDVTVYYRMKTCICDGVPTVFVDLNYISADLTACNDLVCWLHQGPDPCINNPLIQYRYDQLEATLYKDLFGLLFEDVKSQYPCPTTLKFRKYAVGSCKKVCGAVLSAPGQPPGTVIYVPKICNDDVCCYKDYFYCVNPYGESLWSSPPTGSSSTCSFNPNEPPCLAVNDTVDILGITYTVTMVMITECYPSCTDPTLLW